MNKVVIVTGGGRGIGAATCIKLATEGYAICVNYKQNQRAAQSVLDRIHQLGCEGIICQADVSQESDVDRLFSTTEQTLGHVTHLVNNAGVLFQQHAFTDISAERFSNVMQANVLSAFLCAKALVKRSEKVKAIVNVSSAASRTGAPFEYVDYAASKGAMDSLTKGLSLELAKQQIRVNAVRPGFIETDMHSDGGEPDRVNRLSAQIPLQRGGSAQEVANAISWLLSDEASYVTGSFLDIAGGK